MLHRTAWALQRVTRQRGSGPQYGHVHGFRSQPRPFLAIIRSLHNDSDILPSSQEASHDPPHAPLSQSWYIDKVNMLQTDIAMTNLKLDHLKDSTNTQMCHLQTNIENNFTSQIGILTRQISALDSKFDSKFNAFESNFNSKFETLKTDLKQQENRVLWRLVFGAIGVGLVAVGSMKQDGDSSFFKLDRFLPQQTPQVERK